MKQNIWNVILGISLAVLLGLTTDYWWPFGEKTEEEKQEIAPAADDTNNTTTTTTVGVGVDFSIKLKKEESTTPAPQQATTTPFISVCLWKYDNKPASFFEKEAVNGHIQINGLDLIFPKDLRKKDSCEEYCGYLLLFFSPSEKKIVDVIRVKNSLHITSDDIESVTDTLIIDKFGNRYQLPIRTKTDNVGEIGVLDEYVVFIKPGPSKIPKILGIISVVLIILSIVIGILKKEYIIKDDSLGAIAFILGVILAILALCL
jgi:hypothetical protein